MFNPSSRENIDPVWPITIVGFATLLFVGITLSSLLLAAGGATTQPGDVPPPQSVAIGYATSMAAIAMLTACDLRFRPGELSRIGFSIKGICNGLLLGTAAAVVILPTVFGVSYLTQWFFESIHYQHESAHPLLRLFDDSSSPQRWAIVVLAAIIAPVGEELLFRAHLQTALVRFTRLPPRGRIVFGVGVASLIFTLFHGELWMMPPLLALSIGMGAVFQWTQNIFASIAVHVCFNSVSLFYFWYAK